jgi:hypothetical protein
MNIPGQTETNMSPSSEKTSSQVRRPAWSLEATGQEGGVQGQRE